MYFRFEPRQRRELLRNRVAMVSNNSCPHGLEEKYLDSCGSTKWRILTSLTCRSCETEAYCLASAIQSSCSFSDPLLPQSFFSVSLIDTRPLRPTFIGGPTHFSEKLLIISALLSKLH